MANSSYFVKTESLLMPSPPDFVQGDVITDTDLDGIDIQRLIGIQAIEKVEAPVPTVNQADASAPSTPTVADASADPVAPAAPEAPVAPVTTPNDGPADPNTDLESMSYGDLRGLALQYGLPAGNKPKTEILAMIVDYREKGN